MSKQITSINDLINLIKKNELESVDSYLNSPDYNPEILNTVASTGRTLLWWATYYNNPKIVKLLLKHGADTNVSSANTYSSTPLFTAINTNNPEIVKLLLKHGADVNIADTYGRTPLWWATYKNNPDIVKLLLKHDVDASVNIADTYTSTPLFEEAINNNNPDMVKLLLEYGPNIDTTLLDSIDASKVNNHIIFDLLYYSAKKNNSSEEELAHSLIKHFKCYNENKSVNFTKLLDIFIKNIDYFDLSMISSIKEVSHLLQQTEQFNLLAEKIKDSFTQEFREFYNLHRFIKLEHKNLENSQKLIKRLGDLQDNCHITLQNYKLFKDILINQPSDQVNKFKELEKQYLLFNEVEAIKFIIKLLAPENSSNFAPNQSSTNHTFTQSSSAKDKPSSYEEDEKEPAQSNRAMKLLDIAFDYIDILNISLVFEIQEVKALINKYPSILESKVEKMLNTEKLETIFTSEFREFYNLPRFIKFNDKFKLDLLEKLQDKYLTLFDNYNLLKNYFTSSENELIFKDCEEFLLLNEKEESDFVDKLWLEQLFEDVKNQATAGNNNSQDNREISSLDDDEKEPNLWKIEKKQQEPNNTQNHTCTTTVSNDNTTSTVPESTSTSNDENPLNLAGADYLD